MARLPQRGNGSMGLLVALFSVLNIALGYGLAIYLHRASVPGIPLRLNTPRPEPVAAAKPMSKPPLSEAKSDVEPAEVSEEVPEAPPAAADIPVAADMPVAEAAEDMSPPEDEENVLAGIESFRAQLAQVIDECDVAEEAPAETVAAGITD